MLGMSCVQPFTVVMDINMELDTGSAMTVVISKGIFDEMSFFHQH